MKFSTVLSALTVMVAGVSARPHRNWQPAGGWRGVNFHDFDWNSVPFDRVDWTQINWSRVPFATFPWNQVTWGNIGLWQWQSAFPSFTTLQTVVARPRFVIGTIPPVRRQLADNSTVPATAVGGLRGARGVFQYGLLPSLNAICYNIAITGFRGDYQSPARTATHIHQGGVGRIGPVRITFPNPVATSSGVGAKRVSIGCLRGPFATGIFDANGIDTGSGFTVNQIFLNGSDFYTDVHSSLAVSGAVRGQLSNR